MDIITVQRLVRVFVLDIVVQLPTINLPLDIGPVRIYGLEEGVVKVAQKVEYASLRAHDVSHVHQDVNHVHLDVSLDVSHVYPDVSHVHLDVSLDVSHVYPDVSHVYSDVSHVYSDVSHVHQDVSRVDYQILKE